MLVLALFVTMASATPPAWAGWRMVKRVIHPMSDPCHDSSYLPPGGGVVRIDSQADGMTASARGQAVDWTFWDEVECGTAAFGSYYEKWQWVPDPGLDPYAEFKFRSRVDHAVVEVRKPDGSASTSGFAKMTVRVGKRTFETRVDVETHTSSGTGDISITIPGVGSVKLSGFGQPGVSKEPGTHDTEEGDVCNETSYIERRYSKIETSLSADGGLGGKAASSLDALWLNERLFRDLGSIKNCKEGGG